MARSHAKLESVRSKFDLAGALAFFGRLTVSLCVSSDANSEQSLYCLAGTLDYLASAFHCTDSHILSRGRRALAQIGSGVDGMKRRQIAGCFSGSFGGAEGALPPAFGNITHAASYVAFAPLVMGS